MTLPQLPPCRVSTCTNEANRPIGVAIFGRWWLCSEHTYWDLCVDQKWDGSRRLVIDVTWKNSRPITTWEWVDK